MAFRMDDMQGAAARRWLMLGGLLTFLPLPHLTMVCGHRAQTSEAKAISWQSSHTTNLDSPTCISPALSLSLAGIRPSPETPFNPGEQHSAPPTASCQSLGTRLRPVELSRQTMQNIRAKIKRKLSIHDKNRRCSDGLVKWY